MKISTRLALAALLAAGAAAIIGAMLLLANQRVKTELANNEMAGDILNAVTALQHLTMEYVTEHEARPQAQWRLRDASLSKLLSSATGFGGPGEQATLDDLRHSQQNIERLFDELVADRQQGQAHDNSDAVTQEMEARLTGQIMNRAQDMISTALALSDISRRGVLGARQRMNLAVAVFGTVVMLILAATWILMLRSVIRPLARLRTGTVVVGSGNLDHRFAITSRDEIGDLSRAFDEMVVALKASTVSRDELERANAVLQTEIDERRRAEERFRLVVEAAPCAMVMVDRKGSIVLANSQTEKVFGYTHDELVGLSIEGLVPERFRLGHPGYRATFFGDPTSRQMGAGRHLYGLRRDGAEVPVEIGLNPVETSEGIFVLAAIADITERKRAENELRERTEELGRSNRDLEQFAYIASHDLQEPLRAIAGPLQLLQRRYRGQLDARADEYIGHAVGGAGRMQALIEDLLAFSRVATSGEPYHMTECSEALGNALRNLSAAIQESGAQVTHDELPTVRAISGQISVLFQNLLGNAIKFRHKDRPVRIHVGAEVQSDVWVFHVRDNGIGIAPQYFERIFLIFQRLHTRRDYPGTGIGLALCKRIVEHHGGRMWVESETGAGTTFSFSLPRRSGMEPNT
jgi:PAS domain S-box-containing protein